MEKIHQMVTLRTNSNFFFKSSVLTGPPVISRGTPASPMKNVDGTHTTGSMAVKD